MNEKYVRAAFLPLKRDLVFSLCVRKKRRSVLIGYAKQGLGFFYF